MVALNEEHFNELIFAHTPPPPAVTTAKLEASLVRMGFPLRRMNQSSNSKRVAVADEVHPSLCAWYDYFSCYPKGGKKKTLTLKSTSHQILSISGNVCPQCTTKFCDLPTDCTVCGLTLVSSPHLARSYHHLFPVSSFKEVPSTSSPSRQKHRCLGCKSSLPTPHFECPHCKHPFCLDCDTYIHESLHNCPGCESIPIDCK